MKNLIPKPPYKVRRALKDIGVKDIEWDHYAEEKWFGYCKFGVAGRVALTVCLVTGKACIEILAPLYNEDVEL